MLVQADVTCYLCGHVAGWVTGEYATLQRTNQFHPLMEHDKRTVRADGQMRCVRCGGGVFLEGTERIRTRHRREVTAADFADGAATATVAVSPGPDMTQHDDERLRRHTA